MDIQGICDRPLFLKEQTDYHAFALQAKNTLTDNQHSLHCVDLTTVNTG